METPVAATGSDLRADGSSWGTVFLPFGRHFAGRVDMLTRDRFKAIEPINNISPFSAVGDPDPAMRSFADSERTNERVKADVHKDLWSRLAQSGADYLVVDNTPALLWLREHNKRIYTVIGREDSDLMDLLWNGDGADRILAIKPWLGLSRRLRSAYDSFVDACLANFDPSHIVLVRSHVPRFWITDDGTIASTNADPKAAHLLEFLDRRFVKRTSCHVSNAALTAFPRERAWQSFDESLRVTIEADLIDLCRPQQERDARDRPDKLARTGEDAADHVRNRLRANRPIDERWVRKHFAGGGVSYDDLIALAYVKQMTNDYDSLIQDCVRAAVADARSLPRRATLRRFDRSLEALRNWDWCALPLPSGDVSTPQITVDCGRGVFYRFFSDGSIGLLVTSREADLDADAIVDGRLDITPLNVHAFLTSWPVYLERGRRGITAAPGMVVSDAKELLDTCYWLDWAWVLENEKMVITPPGADETNFAQLPTARTDLSFVFHPNTRVCAVGGGLMDQVTHIALYDQLCSPYGLDYYLDDFRYTYQRYHNGFEASRLAPEVDSKRITRLVSRALVERFRNEVWSEVRRVRLPWVFNQSGAWYRLGLREAIIVSRNHPHSRQLLESVPEFPVLIYSKEEHLGELIREPPGAISLFTTQHRISISPSSVPAIGRVFSYANLEANVLDERLTRSASLLRNAPYVALHIRRGDYLTSRADTGGWHSAQDQYLRAIEYLTDSEFGGRPFNVAVFSDDLDFVESRKADYGLDRVIGDVLWVRGNRHFDSIFDSYLMSLCPVIVGSVGYFAATTSLLAEAPSVFIRTRPDSVRVEWRR